MPEIEINCDCRSWNEFVSARAEATLFHHFAWAEALSRGAGHQPYFLSVKERGEVLGVLPLCLVKSRLFGRFLVSLPHYLGGISAANEQAEELLVERALDLARELSVDSLEIRGNNPLPPAERRGFRLDERKSSFLIDLTAGEEAIWGSLRKQTRNRIRKGQQAGLALEAGDHLLPQFWRVFSANMRAIGSPTFSARFFGAVLEAFGEDAQILLARQNQRPVAAKLVLRFRDTLTLLWGGTAPRDKSEGANYYLTWEAIRYALSCGCRVLDMGRSTVDSGPYFFKSHWGGREIRHRWYLYEHRRSAELRAENPRFRLARRLWRRLPLSLTRSLGPWIARQIP